MTSEININTTFQTQNTQKSVNSRYSEEELNKLKKACADFESIFTYQLLKTMRKTIPETKTGMFSSGKDTYTMILDQKLAESVSSNGNGLNLQKVLYEQLTNKNYGVKQGR